MANSTDLSLQRFEGSPKRKLLQCSVVVLGDSSSRQTMNAAASIIYIRVTFLSSRDFNVFRSRAHEFRSSAVKVAIAGTLSSELFNIASNVVLKLVKVALSPPFVNITLKIWPRLNARRYLFLDTCAAYLSQQMACD